MKLLNKYVFKEYLKIFLLTGLTLLSLFIIVSLFDLLTDALEHKARIESVIRYLIFKIPQALYFMSPIMVLISTILCIGVLSKSNEITAMKACGIGIIQIISPILIIAVIAWALTFLNGEYLLPYANKEMERVRKEDIKKEKKRGVYKKDKLWFRSDDGSIWHIGFLGDKGKLLSNITLFQFNLNKGVRRRINSLKAEWLNERWEFFDCWVRTFNQDGSFKAEHFDQKNLQIAERPSDFITVRKDPNQMSYMEIRKYIERIKREGLDPTKYQVDMESKLSFPFICFIMAILGVPFSLKTSRQGGVTLGIGIGLVIGFSVWFIYSMGLSLGHAGKIPVFAASWGSNIAFTILGIYLIITS